MSRIFCWFSQWGGFMLNCLGVSSIFFLWPFEVASVRFPDCCFTFKLWKVCVWDLLGLPQMLSNQMTRLVGHSQVWFQSIAVKMEAFFGKFVVRKKGCSFTKHVFEWAISTIMPRHTDAFLQHIFCPLKSSSLHLQCVPCPLGLFQ